MKALMCPRLHEAVGAIPLKRTALHFMSVWMMMLAH